jgi:lysophospholipase L1-like esterase
MRFHRAALVGMTLLTCCLGPAVGSAAAEPKVSTAPAPIKVLVTGNSEAGTLTFGSPLGPGAHGLRAQPGLTLVDRTILGCSISSAPEFVLASGARVANRCGGAQVWQQRWQADVAATRPDVVFLMAGDRDLYDVAGPDGTVIHPGEPAWSAPYIADVEHLFRILRAGGAPLVAVRPPPCYGADTLPDGEDQASERLDPVRARAVAGAWQAAARATGLRLLDLDDLMCPAGVADPLIRADGVHFTIAGADRLAPTIARALRRAATRDPRPRRPVSGVRR